MTMGLMRLGVTRESNAGPGKACCVTWYQGGDLGRRLTGSAATSRLLLTNLVSGPILKNELKHVLEQLKPKAQIPFLCFPQVNAGEAPVMPKEIGWKCSRRCLADI